MSTSLSGESLCLVRVNTCPRAVDVVASIVVGINLDGEGSIAIVGDVDVARNEWSILCEVGIEVPATLHIVATYIAWVGSKLLKAVADNILA